MKASLALTTLILAGFAALGWQKQNAIQLLREEQWALVSKAAEPGISPNPKANPPHIRNPRADREAEARTVADALIADFYGAMKSRPEEAEARAHKVIDRFYQLNGLQLRVLVGQLRNGPDIGGFLRQNAINSAIMALSDTDPEAAIRIVTEARDLQGKLCNTPAHVIGKWAQADPLAALDWMRNHGAEHPEFMNVGPTNEFITGVATKDPKLAFQLIGEFSRPEFDKMNAEEGAPPYTVVFAKQIVRTARSLEERSAMLGILRDLENTSGGEREKLPAYIYRAAVSAMAEGLATYDYNNATAWLSSSQLRPVESASLRQSLVEIANYRRDVDSSRLIDWFPVVNPDK